MSDAIIRIEGLSKRYQIGSFTQYKAMRDILANMLSKPVRLAGAVFNKKSSQYRSAKTKQFIWALDDISFDVRQGEVIGIIGRNGAGKTTLLKLLARITRPTEGIADVYGRVGSLLEVGTGFHPELSGRENIYLYGAILGMKKLEIDRRFDEIVAFSDLEKFLDTPVKHYSSGMYVRLAFAVASHLETEILLVDEILAVGDAAFQKKCIRKMQGITQEGRTILFVSHNMAAINSLCTRCILVNDGKLVRDDTTPKVINAYLTEAAKETPTDIHFPIRQELPAQIVRAELLSPKNRPTTKIKYQDKFGFRIKIEVRQPDKNYHVLLAIRNHLGVIALLTSDCDIHLSALCNTAGIHEYRVNIPERLLTPGHYFVRFVMMKRDTGVRLGGSRLSDNDKNQLAFEIIDNDSKRGQTGMYGDAVISPEIVWHHKLKTTDLV